MLFSHNGSPVKIKAPAEIREEFVIGKNNWPIHYWFGRYAEKEWGIPFGSAAFYAYGAMPVTLLFSDMEELLNQIDLAAKNPLLRSKLFYVPFFSQEEYLSDWFKEDLVRAGEVLRQLIAEDQTEACVEDYAYEAG